MKLVLLTVSWHRHFMFLSTSQDFMFLSTSQDLGKGDAVCVCQHLCAPWSCL